MKTTGLGSTRWAPLLALTAVLAACEAVTPEPPAAPAPEPAARQATCVDSAIRLSGRGAGIHGAIVADTLHMGGDTAPATCLEPANQSLEDGLSLPDGRTEQAQQSRYYLIVIRYLGGNRLYVLSRRGDGTTCVVDTNDQCIARVTDLPDDFDLETLPDDVAPTIPAGRPAPPTVGPPPGDDAPPAPGDDTPPGTAPPPGGGYTPPVVGPPPGDGAPPAAAGTPPGAASAPQPSAGATGVTVGGPLLSWAAAPRALSYDVYWGAENTDLDTPINTAFNALRIAASADLEADTLYYWRVDAKNEAGVTRGAVWSFTTAAAPPAETPAPAPANPDSEDEDASSSAPVWSEAAKQVRIRFYAHQDLRVEIPMPSGNPAPTVRPKNDWLYGVSESTIEYGEDSLVISGKAYSFAFSGDREYVLVASNQHGSSELAIPYSSRGCGYSQSDLIRQWIGTHTLPLAPPGYTPNGDHCDSSDRSCASFKGSSQVTFTASAIVVNGEPAEYLDRWVQGSVIWCGYLRAGAEDGTVYRMDYLEEYVYANLRTGGGINCGEDWFQARIYAFEDFQFRSTTDAAVLRHSSCTYTYP